MIAVVTFLACLAVTFSFLEWGSVAWMRWGEGWLVPHREKQEHCRVQCATCKEVT